VTDKKPVDDTAEADEAPAVVVHDYDPVRPKPAKQAKKKTDDGE